VAVKRNRFVVERLERRQLLAGVVWLENSGQNLGTNTDGAELGDLDNDGDLDVFAGCRNWPSATGCSQSKVWLNNGDGQFVSGWSGTTPSVADLALGDLDNDGDLDAFLGKVTPFGSQPNEVWFNDGYGNFKDTGQRLNNWARDIELGDVDGDGDLDAVTASIELPSKIWLNDGSGHFTDSGQRLPAWMYRVALGDLDGDGDLDAWFGRGTDSPGHVDRVYLNDGRGEFTDTGQLLNTFSTADVQLGDLDGDGDLDAYLANGNLRGGRIPDRVWINDGTGTFSDSGQRLGRTLSVSVELGDLDGDGDLDAVVANGVNDPDFLGAVVKQPNDVWLNDGTGVFTHSGQEIGKDATFKVQLGDLDGDGDLDAFFGNLGQNNEIWFNKPLVSGDANRDGVFNSADLTLVFAVGEYEDQIASNSTWEDGDWNGDGEFESADLILAFACGCYSQEAVAANLTGLASADTVDDLVGFRFADLRMNLDATEVLVKKGVRSSRELFRVW
jgi:hypothetical protein